MLTETITWHPVAEQLPDADLTVHVATEGCEEPVWLGFLDGETWRDVDGMEITVTHWAEMLKGPTHGKEDREESAGHLHGEDMKEDQRG